MPCILKRNPAFSSDFVGPTGKESKLLVRVWPGDTNSAAAVSMVLAEYAEET